MEPLTQVLFIGVDALDKDLIHQWSEEGHLPTFKNLLETAAWGPVHNSPGLYVGALWPSFFTGVSPTHHGRYWNRQLKTGSYENFVFRPQHVKGEPFWNQLSRANKKVGVIDVPITFPSKDLNGIHIVDWGTHEPTGKITAWPPSLASEVIEKFGENSLVNCDMISRDAAGFTQFRDDMIRQIKKKTELSLHYLKQGEWDAFLTVFSESHCAGHQCWHLHDSTHPLYDPALVQVTGDILKDVYITLDTAVGVLLNHAGPDAHTMVLASHGMGPRYVANFLLDEMLEQLEHPKENKNSRKLGRTVKGTSKRLMDSFLLVEEEDSRVNFKIANAIKWVRNFLPPGVGIRRWFKQYKTSKIRDDKRRELEQLMKRKCFAIPNNDSYGGIRINLAGREPNGVVHPGTEYDDFLQSLTQDLLNFTNVDTGGPIITRVLRSDEIYQGKNRDHLPDLMVEWSKDAPIVAIHSDKTGTITGENDSARTGDHNAEGLFFAVGDSIQPGRIEQPVSIMDVAPTIASLLDVELGGVEGQSIFPPVEIR